MKNLRFWVYFVVMMAGFTIVWVNANYAVAFGVLIMLIAARIAVRGE